MFCLITATNRKKGAFEKTGCSASFLRFIFLLERSMSFTLPDKNVQEFNTRNFILGCFAAVLTTQADIDLSEKYAAPMFMIKGIISDVTLNESGQYLNQLLHQLRPSSPTEKIAEKFKYQISSRSIQWKPSSSTRTVTTAVRTDRHDEDDSRFLHFCKRALKCNKTLRKRRQDWSAKPY